MRKTDISQYGQTVKAIKSPLKGKSKNKLERFICIFFSIFSRFVLSIFVIMFLTGIMLAFSLNMYRSSMLENDIALNINAAKVPLTSFVYANDETGTPKEYQRVYNLENRVWVDFSEIPQFMKDAIIAIEDKRFYDHGGVDWKRTSGAILNFAKGVHSYGGSTLTQQLIKNITEDNEVSLTRKLREIFRALELEKKYSKDEILESYLNIVNFGGGCRGVETAANLYFNKSIRDCSLAECATIAAITQNPTAYNPLYHPENNKERRETVLQEMLDQNKITSEEFENSIEESSSMHFEDYSEKTAEEITSSQVHNWYVETLLRDVASDLCEKYNIGKAAAENMIYSQGLKIYCAIDTKAQSIVENTMKNKAVMPSDKNLEIGYTMMDLNGRILATIGSRKEKTGNLLYDRANVAKRQPGSTIKPLAAYAPIIDQGIYNYSSLIPDQPVKIPVGQGVYKNWPDNWYKGYRGQVTLQWALEKSANAPVAQLVNLLTTEKSYEFLTKKLGFTSLDSNDATSLSALATGGTHYGVTPREMAGAFQIFGNGGQYFKPYTYFYVTDRNDKVLLDHREDVPIQAVSSQTATIMNRLLRNVIVGPEGTGRSANISGWNIVGKTGTTNDDFDSWFIGLSPYAVAGIWTGYDNPKRIRETAAAIRIWKHIMIEYLKDKQNIDFNYDPEVVQATYCKNSGKLATIGCGSVATGYYSPSNMPSTCNGHIAKAPIIPKEKNDASNSSSESDSSNNQSENNSSNSSAADNNQNNNFSAQSPETHNSDTPNKNSDIDSLIESILDQLED